MTSENEGSSETFGLAPFLTLCLCDCLCFCCTILCHCRWTFLCPCSFHLWRKEKESFALQLVSLFLLAVAIRRTSPRCACAQCSCPCSTATCMGESCFAVEMHMSSKLLWLHPRKRVSTYIVFFVTFIIIFHFPRILSRVIGCAMFRTSEILWTSSETRFFFIEGPYRWWRKALRPPISPLWRSSTLDSKNVLPENVLPKNVLLKLTSENGFPKKDFRKWTSEKWTSENGLLKTYFRKYTTGVIYRILFIGIQGVFP